MIDIIASRNPSLIYATSITTGVTSIVPWYGPSTTTTIYLNQHIPPPVMHHTDRTVFLYIL